VAVAAVMPRARTIVICDEVVASPIEEDVFTLEGVRVRLRAEAFTWQAALSVYLLLSSARYGKFLATFQVDQELLPLYIDVGQCVFPESGPYRFEVHFSVRGGGEAMKGEHPFDVLAPEE
jgi:hypothetical protein